MPVDIIDISDLDKAAVLAALHDNAVTQGGTKEISPDKLMTLAMAQKLLDQSPSKHIDRVGGDYDLGEKGVKIGMDFIGDKLQAYVYDRDNGSGAAQSVVDAVRASGKYPRNAIGTEAGVKQEEPQQVAGAEAVREEQGGSRRIRDWLKGKVRRNPEMALIGGASTVVAPIVTYEVIKSGGLVQTPAEMKAQQAHDIQLGKEETAAANHGWPDHLVNAVKDIGHGIAQGSDAVVRTAAHVTTSGAHHPAQVAAVTAALAGGAMLHKAGQNSGDIMQHPEDTSLLKPPAEGLLTRVQHLVSRFPKRSKTAGETPETAKPAALPTPSASGPKVNER